MPEASNSRRSASISAKELAARRAIIAACKEMNALGINQGTSGNISLRFGKVMLITPTAMPYEKMKPSDLCRMPIDGDYGSFEGALMPSTEWRFHLDILKARPEVGAVVHCHSNYATALAICHKPIPAVHYMIAGAGGPTINVAEYATYGTKELSEHALKALEGRTCCLLGNHGQIATGPTLDRALWLAVELETLAKQYVLTQIIGGARVLPDEEIARVVEKFQVYGPQEREKLEAAAGAKSGKPLRANPRRPRVTTKVVKRPVRRRRR
ncbi:MAG TPA: class II aldolase/adducin family protein [Magnetospirillaceae bacterium]|jgi:L-fuculose-phosphate aldolase